MPPKYFYQVQFRSVRGSVLDDQPFLFPLRETFFQFFTGMNRSIIHDNNRFFLERFAECLKASNHYRGMNGWFKDKRMQIILSIHEP
jgi:hypothetical protein